MPTVSVIIPSYNHDRFIRECLQSVLAQTYQDFEIVITDDGSTDHTVEIIESFRDPRIKFYRHERNQGVSVTANDCIAHASGKYIAWLSSDDAWYPEDLELEVEHLNKHPETAVVFGKVDWVDEKSRVINDEKFPYLHVFDVENRSRFEWLRHFFYSGNCLCLCCSLVRRECFDEVGFFHPVLAVTEDFDLWIRICLKHEIWVLDEKLIRFRRMKRERNASGDTDRNRVRNRFEYRQELNHYLQLTHPEDLLRIFPEAEKYGKVSPDIIPYFLGRIALDSSSDFRMLWGLDMIYTLLQNEKAAQKVEEQCGFTYLDLIKLTGGCNIF